MLSNWELFDEADALPFFTVEERLRITRVHNEMQDLYDPIASYCRKNRRIPLAFRSQEEHYDDIKKIRDAEDAAGWPHSNAHG
ncbi:hypothetical protein LCGC14_0769630 [marine sediment metagenome]|uniref:Uncharacterized protein n=1 Tax=marine sediment metagenome TaxID=412755 RepID=A0A0F9SIU8_9ZZZZ